MIDKLKKLITNTKKKGFFHLLSANFLIFFLGFFSQLIVAGILPVEDIGRVKTLQSYLSILTIFSTLGFNISVLKLTSENRENGEKKFLFLKGVKYTLISSLITYLVIVILSYLNFVSNDNLVNSIAPYFYIVIIPMSLNTIFMSFFQGYKKFKLISKIQSISKILSIVFLIFLTYYFYIYGYTISIVLGFVFTSILFIFYIFKYLKNIKKISLRTPLKTHLKYSVYSALSNVVAVIASNIDILLLSYLVYNKKEYGYYAFAVTFIAILRIVHHTIQQVSIPYFSEKADNLESWLQTVKKYFFLSQFVNFTIVLITFFIVPYFISFIYAGKYDNSIVYFKIILIGWFFRGAYNILGGAVIGLGNIRFNFINGLIVAIANSILMYLFIKYFNIIGAAYANAIGGVFAFIIISLRFYFKFIKNHNVFVK